MISLKFHIICILLLLLFVRVHVLALYVSISLEYALQIVVLHCLGISLFCNFPFIKICVPFKCTDLPIWHVCGMGFAVFMQKLTETKYKVKTHFHLSLGVFLGNLMDDRFWIHTVTQSQIQLASTVMAPA